MSRQPTRPLERFSEAAREAMFVARHNAYLEGSQVIEGYHLLHALLTERDPTVSNVLAAQHAEPDRVRALLPPIPTDAADTRRREIPFSEQVQQILAFAAEEADGLCHDRLSGGHLLLGLLRVEGITPEGPLTRSGVTLGASRLALREWR